MTVKYLKTYPDRCIGCNTCMSVCSKTFFKVDDPTRSAIRVVPKDEGFDLVVCDQQYRKCVAECPVEAISINRLGVVTIDKKKCIGCFACVAVCPIAAMFRVPGELNPFKCIACGACAKQCPTDALEIVTQEAQA